MSQRTFGYLAPLIAASFLGAASAPEEKAPEPKREAVPAKPVISAPSRDVQMLFDLDLRRWPEEQFYENMTALIRDLSTKHGVEGSSILLDIAELYLAQMMLPEAGSILENAETLPQDARRVQALKDAHALLRGQPLDDLDSSPLSEAGRSDRNFWRLLHAVATVDPVLLNKTLDVGLVGLSHQTRPIARTILPIMIEAMIETDKLDLAQQSLRLLNEFPDLANASMGYYLRGRTSQKMNNNTTALQAYFEAAKGYDRYAVRSRLAIAEMALEDGGRGALLAATDILKAGLDSWRGDSYEVAVLERMAQVSDASGKPIDALIIRSKIIMRFPGKAAAENALDQAAEDLAQLYADGMDGKLPLADWLKLHTELVPAFRLYPAYSDMVEQLADHLMQLGGTLMAADEYERAILLREDLETFNPGSVPKADFLRSHLKLAEAFLMGGRYALAKEELEGMAFDLAFNDREKVNGLLAEIAAKTGDTDGLLRTHVITPSAQNLRNVSYALWSQNKWPEAIDFYERLWAEYPGQFGVNDATYLLIAAHKAGDDAISERVAMAFPNLTQSEDWARLAESFLTAPPDVSQLTLNAANGRLTRLDDALSRLEGGGL